ncbi:helix-turn-helix domain-containing protein [Streptomyces sp. NPDC050617]|uniref:TrmB family transcriptional regulator n=1 Tax=Streptomyces sp. NPDC050617 TaxID=3154628 RepID=UPI0034366B34
MELDEGSVGDLVALGLARYEARVYLALVARESYTAAEVARAADVPRQRVYDVLDALVRRRLASTSPGRVATFSAVTPELALTRLMAVQRESLERLERVSEGLAAALQPIWSDGRTRTDPLDYIDVLRDPKAIAERFAGIQRQARRELLSFCRPPLLASAEDAEGIKNAEGIKAVRRLRRAGGTVRAVYTTGALADAAVLANVRSFAAAGEEARFAAELPLKLIIADGSLVLCDMPDPVAGAASSTTLYIEHPALGGCLRLAFQTVWESAATADEAGVLPDAGPAPG